MVVLSTHPMRALSPITELTTPTSLRTLQLPLDDADYLSERIPRNSLETTRTGGENVDEDDGSVYSQKSAETVREQREMTSTPTDQRQRTISLPGPDVPLRSPRRAIPPPLKWNGSTSSLNRSATPAPATPKAHIGDQSIPLPSPSAPSPIPGGLPPPPRSMSTAANSRPVKLIRRVTPTASPRRELYLDEEARKHLTEAFGPSDLSFDERSTSGWEGNMAGVGAGRSLSQPPSRTPSRRNSPNASTPDLGPRRDSPSKLHTSMESTYCNIPFLDPPPKKKESPALAPRSRPNSLKKRPKSYHGSRPGSHKSRPNSFHGSVTKEGISPGPASPVLGLNTGRKEMDRPTLIAGSANTSATSPQGSLRPPIVKRQSESSLPKRSDTTRSKSPSQKSPRRRRVSSIFSSIFGSTLDSEHVSRKLSKKSKLTTVSTSDTSRGSTPPTPTSPLGQGLTESPILEEGTGAHVLTAIRTSGTFGIRDDGSDMSGLPQSPMSPGAGFNKAESGDGSVKTHSDGVKRVLYVENNHVGTPDKEEHGKAREQEAFYTPVATTVSSPVIELPVTTQFSIPSTDLIPEPTSHDSAAPHTSVNMDARPHMPHQQSFPPHLPSAGISYSLNHPLNSDHHGLGVLFPHQVHAPAIASPQMLLPRSGSPAPHASPAALLPTDLYNQASTQLNPDFAAARPASVSPAQPLPLIGGVPRGSPNSTSMVDESTQTSRQTSPSKTPRSRPLPHPPSRMTSPLRTPEPTFIPPPPPETAPTTDLPLLIASHLLSTHAAALMRHSSSMTEASETMRKMAKESLDWGRVLMRMADKKPRPSASLEGLPKVQEQPQGSQYEGVPLPKSAATSGSTSRQPPQPGTSQSYQYLSVPDAHDGYDPIREAYDHLTSLPPRPTTIRNTVRGEARRRKADSLPADLLKEAQRLGNEGWRSLHAAEAAWAGAMGRLSEMLEQEHSNEAIRATGNAEGDGSEGDYPRMGVASTLLPSSQSADSYDSIVVQPRSNAATPMTTPSYPLGSPTTLPISQLSLNTSSATGHGRSFLPDEGDMGSPTLASSANGHAPYLSPLSHGIPDRGPVTTTPMDSRGGDYAHGHSDSTIKIRQTAKSPSPASQSPPPASPLGSQIPYPRTLVRLDHPFTQHLAAQFDHEVSGGAKVQGAYHEQYSRGGRQGGYTNAALGLDAPLTGSSSSHSHSHSHSRSNPNSQDRHRERETPSRSTMTSSSNLHGLEPEVSTPPGSGTLKVSTKKLAKKRHPLRGSMATAGESVTESAAGSGFIGGNGDEIDSSAGIRDNDGQKGSLRKKHWWNRKKE
ncbi:hypothetical protein I317_04421 [Kwoniella heveanensis CBS 569]|nr:hypothetical protein I317_04421 [Kwoniella heveanensis CBS 569]